MKLHIKESFLPTDKKFEDINDNNLRYSKENILNACEFAGFTFVQEYPNGKLRFSKDGKFEYFYDWADLIDFLEHYNRYFDNVRTEDIINILNKGRNEPFIKMSESYSLKDQIYAFLDDEGMYTDYNQKIEDVMDNFNLSREDAESFVWSHASGVEGTGLYDENNYLYNESTIAEEVEEKKYIKKNKKESLSLKEAATALTTNNLHKLFRRFLNAEKGIEIFEQISNDDYDIYSYGSETSDSLSKKFEEYLKKINNNWKVSCYKDEYTTGKYVVTCSKNTGNTEYEIRFMPQDDDYSDADIYAIIEAIIY